MLNTLIESKRTTTRSPGGAAASVVLHATLIVLVVAVTAHAGDHPRSDAKQPDVVFIPLAHPEAPPKRRTPPRERRASPRDHAPAPAPLPDSHLIVAPPTIPDKLPPIGLARPTTTASDFPPIGAEQGGPTGAESGTPGDRGSVYVWSQVERQARPVAGNPKPAYPRMLERARVRGSVVGRFVVDTTGRADMRTFTVVDATNALFASAVRSVLPRWRFVPAEAGGHKVKQLVEMPLTFTVP